MEFQLTDNYQDRKLELLMNVSTIAKIPLYVGEWNHVNREKKLTVENTDDVSKINSTNSDLTQNDSDTLVNNIRLIKSIWMGILELELC